MDSERARAALRAVVLAVAGAIAALAIGGGLYATGSLAVLVAVWTGAIMLVEARPPLVPPAPPAISVDAAERQRLNAYLDLSPAPLVAGSPDGRLRAVNRAARRLFGHDDLIAAPSDTLVAALGDATPGRTVTLALPDGGGQRSFALATADLALPGETTRIGALIDIDAELKAAEAGALRELVQVLSHEIVNALTPIASLARTAADMLDDPAPPLDDLRGAIETVARRADGLSRFGEAYRALARLPAPAFATVRLAPFAADLQRLFVTRWPAIALTVDTAHAPSTLHGDADQLTAALWAILQNAAEVLEGRPAPAVSLTVAAAADGVSIAIGDNGPGLASASASDVFRAFFTTKPNGSGVGLALARQIIRAHGGDLDVERGADDVTRFLAYLPAT